MKRYCVLAAILLCCASRSWGISWEYSKLGAMSKALNEGKKVLLVAGRSTCGSCVYMKNTVMTAPINESVLNANYICWDCEMNSCSDWRAYSSGLGSFYLPLMCIIDPYSPNSYLKRSTGVMTIGEFNSWISGGVGSLMVLSIQAGPGGRVVAPGEGDFSFPAGSSVHVAAFPNSGMDFKAWSGTAVDAGKVVSPGSASTSVTVDADHTLTASFVPSLLEEDRFEPDDQALQAGAFPVNGAPQERNIVPRGDADWVRFTLERPAHVVVEVYGEEGDTKLWLYNAELDVLADDDDSGEGSFSKIQSVLAVGTYYAKVVEFGNNDTIASYSLKIEAESTESVLTMEAGPEGTTVPAPGDHTWLSGEKRTIRALPQEGYVFTGWSGSAVDLNQVATPWASHTTITLVSNAKLRAQFVPIEFYTYQGGFGTLPDPYRIGVPLDLVVLGRKAEDYQKHFLMVGDIDLTGYAFTDAPIAPGPRGTTLDHSPFGGVFSGDGYVIRNLTIRGEDGNDVALFGATDPNALIEKVILEEADITGGHYVGALVGWNRGRVRMCAGTGEVRGTSAVGGLVGFNDAGSLQDCYSHVNVDATEQWAGGLVGWNQGLVKHCFSTGGVRAPLQAGGLIGHQTGGDVTASLWDTQTSGQESSGAGIGLGTVEMQNSQTYPMWDAEQVWRVTSGAYPLLFWQVPAATIDPFPNPAFSSAWETTGDVNWILDSENAYSQPYCAKAGAITHSQYSFLRLTHTCTEGEIRFRVKVSCEPKYDTLIFLLDGKVMQRWSGEMDWTEVSYPVSAGEHVFAWRYSKDSTTSLGQDSAWIDDISQ